jgi:hypothetical protein
MEVRLKFLVRDLNAAALELGLPALTMPNTGFWGTSLSFEEVYARLLDHGMMLGSWRSKGQKVPSEVPAEWLKWAGLSMDQNGRLLRLETAELMNQ